MSQIAVITDTDSSLPNDIAERMNIVQVPISILFGEQSFDTGVNIDDASLFMKVDQIGKLPTTAAPTSGKYTEAFQNAFDQGADSVICLTVSSKISASYQAACTSRDLLPGRDIIIVDTNSLSMGQGFMAMAARKAVLRGETKEQAIVAALDVGKRSFLYTALPTLKYLAMSGRVGYLAAGMASILAVKPILTIKDGKLELLERVRTQTKAWNRVIECVREAAGGKSIEQMALIHVNALADVYEFKKKLCVALECPNDAIVAELSPGLSVHAGAGLVGVVIVTSH